MGHEGHVQKLWLEVVAKNTTVAGAEKNFFLLLRFSQFDLLKSAVCPVLENRPAKFSKLRFYLLSLK